MDQPGMSSTALKYKNGSMQALQRYAAAHDVVALHRYFRPGRAAI